jgi:hypothetical protein
LDKNYEESPKFELVSRYAEQLVAKKLSMESTEQLKSARLHLAPLSGAEGYAGALFEAYAIRTLQAGGDFVMRSLDGSKPDTTIHIPRLTIDPVVLETNKLTSDIVPYNEVRVREANTANYSPRLLWPTTTNFPTFDCFYFHTDGTVLPLQMTIAMIHDLKNSGASNAKKYFDGMFGPMKPHKYPAVFVVPLESCPGYKAQKFTGQVDKKANDFGPHFDQFVIGI